MPLQEGEVCLLTLFADVHYYFNSPTANPVHHRFERRAYLYLYHDALNKRGRVEIANKPGTLDQDAVSGYLDDAKLEYSYKQSTLVSVSPNTYQAEADTPHNDLPEWHLPAYDLPNKNKRLYRLHAVDIYLWKAEDAAMLLDSVKRFLRPEQLAIWHMRADLHAEHRDSMSPVVRHLERAAISSPPHAQLDAQPQQEGVSNDMQAIPLRQSQKDPPLSQRQSSHSVHQAFAPMAYNPAAPAAPEQRSHREKTPPPADAEAGTGLVHAVTHNYTALTPSISYQAGLPGPPPTGSVAQSFHAIGSPVHSASAGIPQPPQTPSFAPPPQAPVPQAPNACAYTQYSPQPPALQRGSTYPATQYAAYPSISSTGGPASPGFPQAPGLPQNSNHLALTSPGLSSLQTVGYGPTGTQALSNGFPFDPNQTQHDIHGQVYVPEGGVSQLGQGFKESNGLKPTTSLGKRADKLEKGIGKFLRKLDSKY